MNLCNCVFLCFSFVYVCVHFCVFFFFCPNLTKSKKKPMQVILTKHLWDICVVQSLHLYSLRIFVVCGRRSSGEISKVG